MSDRKLTWKDVKRVLAKMEGLQFLTLLKDLYGLSAENRTFMHVRFLSHGRGDEHLEPYKTRIRDTVCPRKPWEQDIDLSAGLKAIREFKMATSNLSDLLSLMLYYVRCGNDFTLNYGDMEEHFYRSMENMFARIVEVLIEQGDATLVLEFLPKLETEARRVEDFGWGYGDSLMGSLIELSEAFPEVKGVNTDA